MPMCRMKSSVTMERANHYSLKGICWGNSCTWLFVIVHHASTSDTNKAMKKFPVKKFPGGDLFLSWFEEVVKNFGLHGTAKNV